MENSSEALSGSVPAVPPVIQGETSALASIPVLTTAPSVPESSPVITPPASSSAVLPANPPAEIKPPTRHEKIWITVLHLSVIAGVGLLVPLVLYLLKKHGPAVDAHAREASNFHLSVLIYVLIFGALALVVIGLPVACGILFLGWLWASVCSLFAAHHGVKGKSYQYPLTMRLIK